MIEITLITIAVVPSFFDESFLYEYADKPNPIIGKIIDRLICLYSSIPMLN